MNNKLSIRNKKAYFNYEMIDELCCGIVLAGSEVKSVKNGNINFTDSYCVFNNNELWLKNFNISDYKYSLDNHINNRDRKLLLTKQQLKKFQRKVTEKGLTIVPLSVFIDDRGIIKMNISLAKGKREYDKKNTIRERDLDRDMKRM